MMSDKQGKASTETEGDDFGAIGGAAPEKSQKSAPVSKEKEGPKKVKYRSRRENFTACLRQRELLRDGQGIVKGDSPGKYIKFKMFGFETSDPAEIKWLDAYSEAHNDEVFRCPDVDPLLKDGLGDNLDQMRLDELRAACRSRSVQTVETDDENALRYKLLKQLSGFSK